ELIRGVTLAVVVLGSSRWLFGAGLSLGPRAWGGLLIGLVAAMLFFLALTNATASFLIAFKYGVALANLLGLILPVLSGAYFSISALPGSIGLITKLVPLTFAINVARLAVLKAQFSWGEASIALLTSLVCMPVSIFLINLSVQRARKRGTLGRD